MTRRWPVLVWVLMWHRLGVTDHGAKFVASHHGAKFDAVHHGVKRE
jgi:hypothetical protein